MSINLTRSKKVKGRYVNPWKEWKDPSIMKYLFQVFLWEKDRSGIPARNQQELESNLPIHKPDFDKLKTPPKSGIQVMWLGHATMLAQFDGITLITDPQFSVRSGPLQWAMGTPRYRPPPCTEDQLPCLDAVLISHTHFDHLDVSSCRNLHKKFGTGLTWFVPMGLKSWLESTLCSGGSRVGACGDQSGVKVVELDWWQEHRFTDKVKVAFTPAQHWCKRTALDDNMVLWGSWSVCGDTSKFFFAGDTGYSEECFTQIGQQYGPFDVAAIPIGAYFPRWFMGPQHVDPEQAVQLHKDIKSRQSLAIHWGTFKMTYEPYMEPRERLSEAAAQSGLTPDEFVTIPHGLVRHYPQHGS